MSETENVTDDIVTEMPLCWREDTQVSLQEFAGDISELMGALTPEAAKNAKVNFRAGTLTGKPSFCVVVSRSKTEGDKTKEAKKLRRARKRKAIKEAERRFADDEDGQ